MDGSFSMHAVAKGKSVNDYPLKQLYLKILVGVAIVDSFISCLRTELGKALPGPEAHAAMLPPWRRGDPGNAAATAEPSVFRDAAVLILLYEQDGHWCFPLIERSADPGPHSRQIALPGGSLEKGESAEHAAFREFEEELGVPCAGCELLGSLTPLLVPVSRFRILPFIAFSPTMPVFKPAPAEVADWFPVRIQHVAHDGCRSNAEVRHGEETRLAPCFQLSGRTVWGATAMVLAEFASVLGSVFGRIPSCAGSDPV